MKKLIFIYIILAFTVLNCRKYKDGEVTALKNGQPWLAEMSVDKFPKNGCDNCMHITFTTYSVEGFERDVLNLGWLPKKEGLYYFSEDILENRADSLLGAYSDSKSDGDLYISLYRALANDPNSFVEITKITGRRVEGRFQMTAVLDSLFKTLSPALPDTILFLEGEFESD